MRVARSGSRHQATWAAFFFGILFIMKKISDIKTFYLKYEAHVSGAFLLLGFVIDNFTLTRIDLYLDNLILVSYLIVATLGVFLVNLYEGGVLQNKFVGRLRPWAPLPIQFAFGGLFSGFFVFYSRSASLLTSWPFLLFILALLIGNEFFRKRYFRLTFQVSILFIAIFSYLIFFVPIVLHKIGPFIFILSGVLSILIIGLLIYLLSLLIPKRITESKKYLIGSIGSIFIILNFLYFLNIIPPIPLSLKDAGVYHSVVRHDTEYIVQEEHRTWFEKMIPRQTMHVEQGNPIYFYSAVFAPTDLNTEIVHKWQYFNEQEEKWTTITKLQFLVFGGRDGGYRGYSLKRSLSPGLWRVRVETETGQVLGSKKFKIEFVNEAPEFEINTK